MYKLTGLALEHARVKYCSNSTKPSLRLGDKKPSIQPTYVSNIVWSIVNYTKSTVARALNNLTEFCQDADAVEWYQRASCPFFNKINCPRSYKSTKSGNVLHRTQHRPVIRQSTKHVDKKKSIYEHLARSGNNTEDTEIKGVTVKIKGESGSEDSSVPTKSPGRRRKRDTSAVATTTSSPSPSDSKLAGNQKTTTTKIGRATKGKGKSGKKGLKKNRLRTKHSSRSRNVSRSGNASRTKNGSSKRSKPKLRNLRIKLPLSFDNVTDKGWVRMHPGNGTTEMSTIATSKASQANTSKSTPAEVTTESKATTSKADLRAGTGIPNKARKKRDVEPSEPKAEAQDANTNNDSRRYFQSRRFR